MSDQETIERVQQERHTPNHAKIYEQKKTKPKPEPTLAELKASHDNHFLDRQIEMIRKELITMINEKGGE